MEPERQSPYWTEIVGDKWPAIAPTEWRGMADAARAAATTLDVGAAERARNAFEQRIRAGAGLESITDEMRSLQPDPQSFAEALTATAMAFEEFAELVARTRNRILDIVAAATSRIARASADAEADRASGPDTGASDVPDVIAGTVARARAEVDDVVRWALIDIGPAGLPELHIVSDTLGQPGPWRSAAPSPGPRARATDEPSIQEVGGNDAGPRRGDIRSASPFDPEPPNHEPREWNTASATSELSTAGDRIAADAPSGPAPDLVAAPPTGSIGAAGIPDHRAERADPVLVGDDTTAKSIGEDVAPDSVSAAATITSRSAADGPPSEVAGRTGGLRPETVQNETASAVQITADVGSPTGTSTPPVVPLPVVSPPLPQSGAPGTSAGVAASAPSSGPADRHGRAQPPLTDSRTTSADPKPQGTPAAATTQPKVTPAQRDPSPIPGREAGGDESMRNAVAAAMAAAAAPSFMAGEHVDGDLQLARTLLADVLAVSVAVAPWLRWAVTVLRHPGGVSAFVTSNEGRGWIPAGLFLPRMVSTPWVWDLPGDAAWAALADPARVSAEFGVAWVRKFGGRLSALASSAPIDRRLLGQLPGVSVADSVSAAIAMKLAEPGPDRQDRLSVVGTRTLQERATKVALEAIGARLLLLARDAHVRVGKAVADPAASLGAPALRERILRSMRDGVAVPDEWWSELGEIDDLLAASMLVGQLDVAAVPLGELRSERGRLETQASISRALVFERRCNELVLLSAKTPNRQNMRDAVYAHAHIVGDPLFVTEAESTPRVRRQRPHQVITAHRER